MKNLKFFIQRKRKKNMEIGNSEEHDCFIE